MSRVWYNYSQFHKKGTSSFITKKSVLPRKMVFYLGLKISEIGRKGGVFCPISAKKEAFFTRGQLWPSGIVVACVCVCVCLSVNHQLVRAITNQLFKLESPNLDQRCKRPWLRSLLFPGAIDLELQGQIELKSQNLPHFELVRAISHHQLKSTFPNFGQKCILALLRSLLNLGWIDLDVLFHF